MAVQANHSDKEVHEVKLFREDCGLGITVAGYICREEDISGIFVKEISKGSVADLTGKIRINDRIVKVNGVPITALSNYRAIEILKNSGPIVVISVERYLKKTSKELLEQSTRSLEMLVSSSNLSCVEEKLALQTLPEVLEKDKTPPKIACDNLNYNSLVSSKSKENVSKNTPESDESDFELSFRSASNEGLKSNSSKQKNDLLITAKAEKSDNSVFSDSSYAFFSKISDDTENNGYETCIDESLSDDICAKNQLQINCDDKEQYHILCAINNNNNRDSTNCKEENYLSSTLLETNINGALSEPCLNNKSFSTTKWNSNSNLKSYSSAENDEFFLVQYLAEETSDDLETKCFSEPHPLNLLKPKTLTTFRRLRLREYYNDYEDCLEDYRSYVEEKYVTKNLIDRLVESTTETRKDDVDDDDDDDDDNDEKEYTHGFSGSKSNSAPNILECYFKCDVDKTKRRFSQFPGTENRLNDGRDREMTVTSKQNLLYPDINGETLNRNWGSCKTIQVDRNGRENLGISIVCGKVDLYNSDTSLGITSGIFIKNVTPDSIADKSGQFHVGDRILQVDGIDLRDANQEEAVEVIRNAKDSFTFVVSPLVLLPVDNENGTITRQFSSLNLTKKGENDSDEPIQIDSNVPYHKMPKEIENEINSTHEEAYDQKTAKNSVKVRSDSEDEEKQAEEEEEDEFGYTTDKIKKKYANLGNTVMMIQLERSQQGLGLSLAGHKDRNCMAVFVCGLNPNGAAYKTGGIQVGDEILEVNGIVLHGRCHLNASAIIKGLAGPTFKILVLRRKAAINDIAVRPVTHFPVSFDDQISEDKFEHYPNVRSVTMQKGNRSLGIMIIEGKHAELGQGIFISDIQIGSAAEKAGLEIGEMILAVNRDLLLGASYDIAAGILKRTEGVVTLTVSNPIKKSALPIPTITDDEENKLPVTASSRTATPIPEPVADPTTCTILAGRNTTIEIATDNKSLGLFFVGGTDTLIPNGIVILEVFPGGAAFKDGRLKPGDQILEVSGTCLKEATFEVVLQTLRQILPKVKLVIFRPDKIEYDSIEIDLLKKPGKGLGLSLMGKNSGDGVYVFDILNSDIDGKITRGDLLISINGQSVEKSPPDEVGSILKTLVGRAIFKFCRFKPVIR